MVKKLLEFFMKKNCKKLIKKNLEKKKYLKEKVINCMSSGKGMIVILIVGLIKKISYKNCQYFSKSFKNFGRNINVKIDLSNYATKTDIKNISHVDTSSFAHETNLASLKTEVDKLNIDKLVPIPADLSKLSNVVKIDVVKKIVYDKLVAKVNNIDTSDFVLKTNYQKDKTELKKKIPDVTDFVKKAKLTGLENKIPDVSSLATKTALIAAEKKYVALVIKLKKQSITLKLQKLKINLIIIIMANILTLQSLIY